MTLNDFAEGCTPGVFLGRLGDYRAVKKWIDSGLIFTRDSVVPDPVMDHFWLTEKGEAACGIVRKVETVSVKETQREMF